TVMYKKTEVLKVGGYGNFRRNQDLDLFVRMLHNGCLSANLEKSLLLFRANKDNLKRRKSWQKCSSYIKMINSFRKQGYSTVLDLTIVTVSQLIIYCSPPFFLDFITSQFLREK